MLCQLTGRLHPPFAIQIGVEGRTGTMTDHEVGKFENSIGILPSREPVKRIAAENQGQGCLCPRTQVFQSIDRIRGPAALDFERVDAKTRMLRDRMFEHRAAVFTGGMRLVAMYRMRTGHELNFGRIEQSQYLEGYVQVAAVHRIEGAAENPG